MLKINAICVSPGIAVGKAYILDRRQSSFEKKHITSANLNTELKRLSHAIKLSVRQILDIQERISEAEDQKAIQETFYILDAHRHMLEDQIVHGELEELIRASMINAEWAVYDTFRRYSKALNKAGDQYLRDRRSDFDYVCERILSNLTNNQIDFEQQDWHEYIILAYDISPANASLLLTKKVKGFITVKGGATSHTAIIAHAMGVPAVVGAADALSQAGTDDLIIVDGFRGEVIIHPDHNVMQKYFGLERLHHRQERKLKELAKAPAVTTDGRQIFVKANIEFPEEVNQLAESGAGGIGLYRSEFLFLGSDKMPNFEKQYDVYSKISDLVSPDKVTIRTIDIGSDKLIDDPKFKYQPNPALGYRAIRFCLDEEEIFETQLRAIIKANKRANIEILIPMISTCEELMKAREIFERIYASLKKENTGLAKPKFGCMLEVPSAIIMLEELQDYADFFSIGTNDLVQYTLGVDRNNDLVAYLYNSMDPSVLRSLDRIIRICNKKKKPVSLCGEMAAESKALPLLVGSGITRLSLSIPYIPQIKNLVRYLDYESCKKLWAEALSLKTAKEIEELTETYLEMNVPQGFLRTEIKI